MTTIGILGVGGLAGLMPAGAAGCALPLYPVATRGRGVRAAGGGLWLRGWENNQDVVDRADAIFVSLPAHRADELSHLTFRTGQPVLSAMAGTGLKRLAKVIGPARAATGMMPGYANAYRMGPSILFPGDGFWEEFLSHVGPVHVLESEDQFTAAASFGALSGATVWWMGHLADWFAARGLAPDVARALVAETLKGNAEVILREARPMADIAKGVTTPGGITLQLLDHLDAQGALDAWHSGLDEILARIARGR